MGDTKIEWAQKVWNPITGCSPCAIGCVNCYAKRMARRLAGRYGYPADEPFRVTLHPERLDEPSHWKKPRRVFGCSMGDLFHADVPDTYIKAVFDHAAATRHTFLFLTKRPERMASVVARWRKSDDMPPNLWFGISCSTQADLDRNVPHLLRCQAAVRFLSLEPLLRAIDLCRFIPSWASLLGLDWVIAGCESGPKHRHVSLDAFCWLRDQCEAASVPFFLKQAEINGKIMKMPALDGKVWDQLPEVKP